MNCNTQLSEIGANSREPFSNTRLQCTCTCSTCVQRNNAKRHVEDHFSGVYCSALVHRGTRHCVACCVCVRCRASRANTKSQLGVQNFASAPAAQKPAQWTKFSISVRATLITPDRCPRFLLFVGCNRSYLLTTLCFTSPAAMLTRSAQLSSLHSRLMEVAHLKRPP